MNAPSSSSELDLPIVTVDLALFTLFENRLHVMLVRRGDPNEPYCGRLALPGVWLRPAQDDDLLAALQRGVFEKTGITPSYVEQLYTFGSRQRDPRRWSVSVVYLAVVPWDVAQTAQKGRAVQDVFYQPVDDWLADAHEPLAFDHDDLLHLAITRLRSKVNYSSLPAHLLPSPFTKTQLQTAYEQVLGTSFQPSNFRRKLQEEGFLVKVKGKHSSGGRPADLFCVKDEAALSTFRRTLT